MIRLPAEGESFGRYRLTRKLGQGGMGVVYAAHDTTLDREVALKLVAPQLANDAEFRARFQHEAATLARLESAHIVRIYDHGEQDGVLYLVTQLVPGGDLLQLIRRDGAVSPALAADLICQVLQGLCDAHAVGVVHRDIKPANVLLRSNGRDTEAFLCDFGIATTPGADLSRTGTVAGSLPYMAPERHQGKEAGPQGDVYAAGCLLWHTLTGTAPYAGTDVEVAMGHLQAPVPQLPGKDDFTTAINEVLRRSMAKDRSKRYPTARSMLGALSRARGLAPDAITLPGATSIRQVALIAPSGRRWRPAAVALMAVALVTVGAASAMGALGNGEPRSGGTAGDRASLSPPVSSAAAERTGVAERQTLLPRARAGGRSGGREVPAATRGPGGDRPGATAEAPALPGATAPRTKAPRQETTAPRPPPTPARRCWNGTRADSCTLPVGWPGATWIFQGMGGPPFSCHPDDLEWTSQEVEAWECNFGANNWVYVSRWPSTPTAVSALQSHLGASASDWRPTGGASWGYIISNFGERYYQARVYSAEPWAIQFSVSSVDALSYGTKRSGPWREPAHLRGVPND